MSDSAAIILNIGGTEPIRAARSTALRDAGYRVYDAAPGPAALGLAEAVGPQLVVLDAAPPEDRDLGRRIRHDFPAVPLLLLADGPADRPLELVAAVHGLLRLSLAETSETQWRRGRNLTAVGQFNAGRAHDFNNLLQAVRASLELIRHRTAEPRIAELARHGLAAIERGAEMTGQLQNFAHRQKPELAPVDVNGMIRALAERLGRAIGPAATLRLDLDPAIAAAVTDADQLTLALLNLAANARDAMPDGGTLALRTAEIDGGARRFVEIRLRDTGCGMPPEVLARALEPFFTTQEDGRGAGLGLAQVQAIARQSGGQFRLDSELGGGTTACLLLPAAAGPSAPPRRADPGTDPAPWP